MKSLPVACVLAAAAILLPSSVVAQTFVVQGSLYADAKAQKVGDIVTIHIVEYSQGKNEATTRSKKESVVGGDLQGDGLFKFLPISGFEASNKVDFNGKGNTNRTGQLRAKLTARITAIDANGNFVIEGHREVGVNNERMVMSLTGVVRPIDINFDNTVMSYNIADAKISYRGKGHANTSQKPGLITRILNWIF